MDTMAGKVGIVGTGLIGAGWAAFYASKGFAVSLFDAEASARQAGRERTLTYLAFLREHGLLDPADHDRAVAGVEVTDDLSAAVEGARLVQESVTERYDVKMDVLRQIDRAAEPEAIVASSSSGLLISELQTVMERPGRSLIAHPFNPPHLIPLVELVPGKQTDPKVLAEAKTLFEALGKVPVVLNKEVPGHIANRLQAAVWREAIDLVLNGVASVADVDKALASGPGIRWAPWSAHDLSPRRRPRWDQVLHRPRRRLLGKALDGHGVLDLPACRDHRCPGVRGGGRGRRQAPSGDRPVAW